MTRLVGSLTLLATVAALLTVAPVASAKGCRVGDERSYGTTYVTKISVSGASCRTARKVVRAFHACRPGKAGRCSGVLGYHCSESRFNKSSLSYDSRVTCHKGGRTVKHTYTQFI